MENGNHPRLLVIDANSLLHRAFHALPPLTDAKGRMTNAVYGFLLILFRAEKDLQATHAVACFDTKKPTFRHEAFKEYKAHRAETPQGLAPQFSVAKEVLTALGVPVFEKEGFEADDLVATIATKAQAEVEVFILSGDLDNLQLVNDRIKLYTMGKGIKDSLMYGPKEVEGRFGVSPSQMNDFKALTGDTSDNVPGVPGIGKTTAAELLKRYGSVQVLYDELATDTAVLKPRVKASLKENKEKAFLSLRLVETKKDVDLPFSLKACRLGAFDRPRAKTLFQELGFASLVGRL